MSFFINLFIRDDPVRSIQETLTGFESEFTRLQSSSSTPIQLKNLIDRVSTYTTQGIRWNPNIPTEIRSRIFSLQQRITEEISRNTSPLPVISAPLPTTRRNAWTDEGSLHSENQPPTKEAFNFDDPLVLSFPETREPTQIKEPLQPSERQDFTEESFNFDKPLVSSFPATRRNAWTDEGSLHPENQPPTKEAFNFDDPLVPSFPAMTRKESISPLLVTRTTYVSPFLLKACPENLKNLVADAILLDWKVCSLINSETLLNASLGTYEVDRVVWGLKEVIDQIDDLISSIQDTLPSCLYQPPLLELQTLLLQRKEILSHLYSQAIEKGSLLTIRNNTSLINLVDKNFKQSFVDKRIALHEKNLTYIQQTMQITNPTIELEITTLKRYRDQLLSPIASCEINNSFYSLYTKNHLFKQFLLNPNLLSFLKQLPSYERDMHILQLSSDLEVTHSILAKALEFLQTTVFPNETIRDCYFREYTKLQKNHHRLQVQLDLFYDVSAQGTFENDQQIAAYLQQMELDPALDHLIRKGRVQLSKSNSQCNSVAASLHEQTVSLYFLRKH